MLPLEDGEIGTVAGGGADDGVVEPSAEAPVEDTVPVPMPSDVGTAGVADELTEEPAGVEAEPSASALAEAVMEAATLGRAPDAHGSLVAVPDSGVLVQATSAPANTTISERLDTMTTRGTTRLLRS